MALRRRTKDATRVASTAKVAAVELPARRLGTVPPDHFVWKADKIKIGNAKADKGAIVRVQPPADASEERVQAVVAALRGHGAIVRLDSRARAGATVPAKAHELPAPVTHRQAVEQLVAEAHTQDRDALEALCEEVMSECLL